MRLRIYIFWSIALFLGNNVEAQQPAYFQYTVEEGLPNNTVYDFHQDKDGFFWIGTAAGLARFDGYRFHWYRNKAQSLRSISSIVESSGGRLYCRNFKGQIFYVENDSLHELESWSGKVAELYTDNQYRLWVASQTKGLWMYDELLDIWKPSTQLTSSGASLIEPLNIVRQGAYVYTSTSEGIYRYQGLRDSLVSLEYLEEFIHGDHVFLVTEDAEMLFLSKEGGKFYRVDSTGALSATVQRPNLRRLVAHQKLTGIHYLQDGLHWISTYSGVIAYDAEADTGCVYFPERAISSVTIDQEGHYWFGCLYEGLLRVPTLDAVVWPSQATQRADRQITRLSGGASSMYFSTQHGKVYQLDLEGGGLKHTTPPMATDFRAFYYDSIDARLYLGTNNSLFTFKNGRVQFKGQYYPTKCILHDSLGYFFGTSQGGFWYKSLEQKEATQQLNTSWTRAIAYNRETKHLYLATNEGLEIYNYTQDSFTHQQTLLPKQLIGDLFFESCTQRLFALTIQGALLEVDADATVRQLTQLPPDAQSEDFTFYKGQFFIATTKGCWVWDLRKDEAYRLSRHDGLISNDVRRVEVYHDALWLATDKGLQRWPIHLTTRQRRPFLVYLKSIKGEAQQDLARNMLFLKYKEALLLRLESPDYLSNRAHKFAYRFEGDTVWSYSAASQEGLRLLNIPSGDFTLIIKAVDYWGNDSNNQIVLHGSVATPFWQQRWFYFCLFLAAIGGASYFFGKRIQRIKERQEKELERLNLEAALSLSQQKALRAQMNPHFIFNVLNSIKSYIYENDKKQANLYLTRFAQLMRRVLMSSEMDSITLEEELQSIMLYIELEAMLMDDDFEYRLVVDECIDAEMIQLPPLILQPYVENAFKHGLRYKKGPKRLEIICNQIASNKVEIRITDNGIGRQAAAKYQATRNRKHHSFATEATQHRAQLLSEQEDIHLDIEFIDHTDKTGQPTGTTVRLTIQYEEIQET